MTIEREWNHQWIAPLIMIIVIVIYESEKLRQNTLRNHKIRKSNTTAKDITWLNTEWILVPRATEGGSAGIYGIIEQGSVCGIIKKEIDRLWPWVNANKSGWECDWEKGRHIELPILPLLKLEPCGRYSTYWCSGLSRAVCYCGHASFCSLHFIYFSSCRLWMHWIPQDTSGRIRIT